VHRLVHRAVFDSGETIGVEKGGGAPAAHVIRVRPPGPGRRCTCRGRARAGRACRRRS
jgi:hypothetical protein